MVKWFQLKWPSIVKPVKAGALDFLEMSAALEAKEAIDALNGARLRGGKELVVREAEEKPRDSRDNSGGGYRPRR